MSEGESRHSKFFWWLLVPLAITVIGAVVQALVPQLLDSGDADNGNRGGQVAQTDPTTAPPTVIPPTLAPTQTPTPIADGCWTWEQQVGSEADASPTAWRWSAPPATVIDPATRYTATIETSEGTIQLALATDESPQAVNNFVCLARAGFFDGTPFYRVAPGSAIYGGDPTGTGTGGPGYRLPDEPSEGDYRRGTLAMVSEGPNTSGSRFFITLADLSGRLPPRYAIVGRVIGGQAVLDALAAVPAVATPGEQPFAPAEPVIVTKVTIAEG